MFQSRALGMANERQLKLNLAKCEFMLRVES